MGKKGEWSVVKLEQEEANAGVVAHVTHVITT